MKTFILGLLLGVVLCAFAWWISVSGLSYLIHRPERSWPAARNHPEDSSPAADGWACTLDDHYGSLITFTHAGESHAIRADPKTAWSDPILNSNGTTLFVILHDRVKPNAFNFRAVVRFDMSPIGQPWSDPIVTTLIDDPQLVALTGSPRAWIGDLHSISDDGQRLLVTAGIQDTIRSSGQQKFYVQQPYSYDIAQKKLTKTRP